LNDAVKGELRYFARTLPKDLKRLEVIPISDVHYGNPLFTKNHLMRTIKYINDNSHVYAVFNGDLCESTIKSSKGEIFRQVGTPQDQRDWIIDQFKPISHKILGCTQGNHERRISNETGIDICKDIAEALGVPYRSEGILIKISFGSGNNRTHSSPYVYWCYATHGYGGARTASAKAVKVERTSTFIHADFYIMSHDHVVNAAPVVYLVPDNRTSLDKETGFMTGAITAHRKMLVKSSAYLKWGGYAEAGGYSPNDLETPIIKLAGEGKPRVRVEI
jgi:hypothetical protein